jgi:hypothetical protein
MSTKNDNADTASAKFYQIELLDADFLLTSTHRLQSFFASALAHAACTLAQCGLALPMICSCV